jgi:hypothetical protein
MLIHFNFLFKFAEAIFLHESLSDTLPIHASLGLVAASGDRSVFGQDDVANFVIEEIRTDSEISSTGTNTNSFVLNPF